MAPNPKHRWPLYAGTVLMSFYYAFIPTCGNWFKKNQPKHKLDDCAGDTVTLVLLYVLPVRKIWHFSGKFDQHLSLYCGAVKLKVTDWTRILVLVRDLLDMISKIQIDNFIIVSSKCT